jgi:formyl-CoA transferase
MGAEVIKVDPPVERTMNRPDEATEERRRRDAAYNSTRRNKRSIVLDLKSEGGYGAFCRLVATADILIEGYRPGVGKRLRIDYERMRAIKPSLIYCSVTGLGQTGPYAGRPAHEHETVAISGATAQNIDRNGEPTAYGVLFADSNTALHAAIAMLVATIHRMKTGVGQYIDVSMAGCAVSFQTDVLTQVLATGSYRRPTPYDLACVRCKDGLYISCSNTETHLWRLFCKAIGLPELETVRQGTPEWPAAEARVEELMLTRTRDEWVKIIVAGGAAAAPVYSPVEALADAHFLSQERLLTLDHPTEGQVRQLAFPIKFSATPAEFRSFAPLRGQDTEAILGELGFTPEEMASMRPAS